MGSTVQERELSVNLGNSVYIIHSCDPPQILSLDRQTFVEGWTCKRNGKNIILR